MTRRRLTLNDAEGLVLVVILLTVAGAAGWASFSHVHDWTMRHVPDGTPDAFGWVNAIISELVPVAAFLVIRRRRRTGDPIGYPVVLLIASASLSLAAQLAVADKSPSGWLLSAVPALAFMALVKLVFTSDTATVPAITEPVTADADQTPAEPSVVAHDPVVTPVAPDPTPAPARSVVPSGFLPPPTSINGNVFTSGGVQ